MKVQELINLLATLPNKNIEVVFDLPYTVDDYGSTFWQIDSSRLAIAEHYEESFMPRETEEDKMYIKSRMEEVLVLS